MSGGLDALQERGFVQQCTDLDALERALGSKQVTLYCGFDPTGPSLHAGHLIPLFAMSHLYRAGHRAIALVGGGTARIGDPSGKTEMRKIESVETIQANALRIRDQIGRFMDFDGRNALLVDNADWLANLNYIEFLRDIGRHFSVNRMLSFETYKMRLETGLSFIEFNYQLLQSYDYLILNQQQGCELQIGGDDQWGNIVAGVDLVRRVEGNEVFGLTFPLVTRADGKKMGKTEKGALYLDPAMTSPYDFYQYWRNVPDADVEKFLLLYTFLPVQEIKEIGKRQGKELNEGKSRLAFELTRIVHGEEEATKARTAAEAVFGGTGDAAALPSMELTRAELDAGINVVELFARTSLCNTKSEARRLVQQGGAIVNDTKVSDIDGTVDTSWLSDGQLLLRAGKKRYFRVVLTS